MSNPSIWDPESPISLVRQLIELFRGTSLTTNTVGTGNKTFVTNPNLYFEFGQWLLVVDVANANNYMTGQVISYDIATGDLVLDSKFISGSGTKSNWVIYVSGAQALSTWNGGTVSGASTFNATVLFNQAITIANAAVALTGTATLTLAADPVAPMQAATKQYVDGLGFSTGMIAAFARGVSIRPGWLECDGSAVSRVGANTALFAYLGTTYGSGDGINTFNLPDLRRRTLVGRGGSATGVLGNAVSNTGGEETHQMTLSELIAHHHIQTTFQIGGSLGNGGSAPGSGPGPNANTTDTGSSVPFNVMQPSMVTLYCIKQ